MKKEGTKEKASYEPPILEVVEVKMERNFASTGGDMGPNSFSGTVPAKSSSNSSGINSWNNQLF